MNSLKLLTGVALSLLLGACATQGEPSGMLSSYDDMTPRENAVRAQQTQRRDDQALAQVQRVVLEPAVMASGEATAWLSQAERVAILREIDAQMCFELTERYDLAATPDDADARVRTVVSRVAPTGRAGSAVAAAASFFIPGPVGVRMPGSVGALGAEAEMLARDGRQIAAIVWNRDATVVGTDDPSLSPIGDALQFAEPFADAASAAMTATDRKSRPVPRPDPCATYGARLRVEGWAAKFVTGLYVPAASGAKAAEEPTLITVPPPEAPNL